MSRCCIILNNLLRYWSVMMEASTSNLNPLDYIFVYFPQEKNEVDDVNKASETICALKWVRPTGTCFIKKIYAPSSSLLQGKHLPFTPSPLLLNIFRLFVILSLTQLYRYTPEIFLFSTTTFKYNLPVPPQTNWTRIFSKSGLVKI